MLMRSSVGREARDVMAAAGCRCKASCCGFMAACNSYFLVLRISAGVLAVSMSG